MKRWGTGGWALVEALEALEAQKAQEEQQKELRKKQKEEEARVEKDKYDKEVKAELDRQWNTKVQKDYVDPRTEEYNLILEALTERIEELRRKQ